MGYVRVAGYECMAFDTNGTSYVLWRDEDKPECLVISNRGKSTEEKLSDLQADEISVLRFESVFFGLCEYNSLDVFNNITRIEFDDCMAYGSETPKSSAMAKIRTALGSSVSLTEYVFENSRYVDIANLQVFTSIKSLTIKRADYIRWENFEPDALKVLVLEDVNLAPSMLHNIAEQIELETLELSGVYRRDDVCETFLAPLTSSSSQINDSLKKLRLSNMNIRSSDKKGRTGIFGWIEKLKRLEYLDLSHNKIVAIPDSLLCDLKKLQTLILSYNPIWDVASLGSAEDVRSGLETLELKKTSIGMVPQVYGIRKLDISECHRIKWCDMEDFPPQVFENLEWLDVSSTELTEIPHWFNVPKDSNGSRNLQNLKYIDISRTKITEIKVRVPSLICLVAERLHLNYIQERLLTRKDWMFIGSGYDKEKINTFYDASKSGGYTDERRMYLRETQLKDISNHFFANGTKDTRQEFWEYDLAPQGQQATIVFIGDKDAKKTAICSLFDVTERDFINCIGQCILRTSPHLKVHDMQNISGTNGKHRGERLAPNSILNVRALSSRPQYRSGHGMFMIDNALYVILLKGENVLDIQRRLDMWMRCIKNTVATASVLVMLRAESENSIEALDIEKYRADAAFTVHKEIAFLPPIKEKRVFDTVRGVMINVADPLARDNSVTMDRARGVLTHAIQQLPSYSGRVIAGWRHALRHISATMEMQRSISHEHFRSLCSHYIRKIEDNNTPSGGMFKVLRKLLDEAGISYDGDTEMLYSNSWLARFVYATLDYAKKMRGEVDEQGLRLYLLDNVIEYDYSPSEIKMLLETLSNKSANLYTLCYKLKGNGYNYSYRFPQFMLLRDNSCSCDVPHANNGGSKAWEGCNWSKISKDVRENKYANRYIVDMPMFSEAMYVDILCKLSISLRDSVEIASNCVATGADGLIAVFEAADYSGDRIPMCCLLVDGVPSAPGRFHIYVAPYSNDKYDRCFDSYKERDKLTRRLTEIAGFAFDALYNAVRKNFSLFAKMNSYLILPNHNFDVSVDEPVWRVGMREICACKKAGKMVFESRGRNLPMDKLYSLVPRAYKDALNDYFSRL
ncbi:MAG: leucine-rich repeat domain-containing protein [Defluviitaleaceae bacterium]|nr:leucine-rich repeat domain-containing protein [Defluviitaleaceae bacterium]